MSHNLLPRHRVNLNGADNPCPVNKIGGRNGNGVGVGVAVGSEKLSPAAEAGVKVAVGLAVAGGLRVDVEVRLDIGSISVAV